ncbi:endoplasmic reticulum metallopeptidase 1-like [Sabethes cyaneus]|uniref:endoplasmic reticulum metallopeptidase 1-like n=1 Tax=Sabethes cyaneus TaxID=53552 RepID=UPI00237E4B69|nr:endoplasmic reticulum metallopeptidase 1-like [Sabethes cyaneus]
MAKASKKVSKTAYYRIDDEANNIHRVGPQYGILVVLLVLAAGSVTNYFLTNLPDALTIEDLERYPNTFIAERAWNNLKSFVDLGPRVAGTKANDELAVEIFKREIEAIQATKHADHEVITENQIATGVFNFTFYGTSMTTVYRNVQNVVVKLAGESDNALLLNCHFDTVPGSPGASDDIASCAVMLEILRVMSRTPGRNKHSIIFLFNGAEETLLQASHGFITQHPWAKQVKAFINLESAGSGGKEVLFQSGPNRPWMVDVYAKTVRYPFAQAMAEELFKTGLIPSDTDFRIFRDYGEVPGMDLAHFLNGYRYHTKYDSLDYLSLPVLQHTGDNALALTRGIANNEHLSAVVDEQESSAVFYDFLGLIFINYSSEVAKFINVVVAMLSVLIPYLCLSRATDGQDNKSIRREAFYGFLAILIGTVLSLSTVTLLARQMEAMNKLMTWYSNRWLILCLYCAPVLVVHCLTQMFFNSYFANKKTSLTTGIITQAKIIGVNIFWSIASLSLTFAGYRCAYIFMILQLCSVLTTTLNWLLAAQRTVRKWLQVHLLFQLVAIAWSSFYYIVFVNLFVPITGRSGRVVNPDFIIGTVVGLCVVHTCSYLLPLITLVRKPSQLTAGFCAIFLLTLPVVCFTSIGFPYRDSTAGEPSTQRHIVTHTMRAFHDEIGLLKYTDNGFLFETMDVNGGRTLKQHIAFDDSFTPIENMKSCKDELFCAIPFDAMWRQMHFDHFWQSAETAPIVHNMFTLAYEGKEKLSDHIWRINFKAEGNLQSAVYVGPKPGVELVAWSLQDVVAPPVTFNNQKAYFVYITHGLANPKPWNITMDFKIENPSHDGLLVEFGVVSKFWEYHEMHNDEFKELLAKFPPWTNVVPSVAIVNMFAL